jgi:hypothetical protein
MLVMHPETNQELMSSFFVPPQVPELVGGAAPAGELERV